VAEGERIEIFPVGGAGVVSTGAFYALLGDGPLEQDPAFMKTSLVTEAGGVNVTVAMQFDNFHGAWPKPVFALSPGSSSVFGRVNELWTDQSPLRDGERLLDVTAWGEGRAIAAIRMAEEDLRFQLVGSAGGVAVPGPGKATELQEGCATRFDPNGAFHFAGTPSGHLFAAGKECKTGKALAGFWEPKKTLQATGIDELVGAGATPRAAVAVSADEAYLVFDGKDGTKIVTWTGQAWRSDLSPFGTVTQMFVAADGSTWAIGEKGLFTHPKGGSWKKVDLGEGVTPTSAWAKSEEVLWVVLDDKKLVRKGPAAGEVLKLPKATEVRAAVERDKRWPATRVCKKTYVMLTAIGPTGTPPPKSYAGLTDAVKDDAALTTDVDYLIEEVAGNQWVGARVPSLSVAEKLVVAFKAKNPKASPLVVCHEPLAKGALSVK